MMLIQAMERYEDRYSKTMHNAILDGCTINDGGSNIAKIISDCTKDILYVDISCFKHIDIRFNMILFKVFKSMGLNKQIKSIVINMSGNAITHPHIIGNDLAVFNLSGETESCTIEDGRILPVLSDYGGGKRYPWIKGAMECNVDIYIDISNCTFSNYFNLNIFDVFKQYNFKQKVALKMSDNFEIVYQDKKWFFNGSEIDDEIVCFFKINKHFSGSKDTTNQIVKKIMEILSEIGWQDKKDFQKNFKIYDRDRFVGTGWQPPVKTEPKNKTEQFSKTQKNKIDVKKQSEKNGSNNQFVPVQEFKPVKKDPYEGYIKVNYVPKEEYWPEGLNKESGESKNSEYEQNSELSRIYKPEAYDNEYYNGYYEKTEDLNISNISNISELNLSDWKDNEFSFVDNDYIMKSKKNEESKVKYAESFYECREEELSRYNKNSFIHVEEDYTLNLYKKNEESKVKYAESFYEEYSKEEELSRYSNRSLCESNDFIPAEEELSRYSKKQLNPCESKNAQLSKRETELKYTTISKEEQVNKEEEIIKLTLQLRKINQYGSVVDVIKEIPIDISSNSVKKIHKNIQDAFWEMKKKYSYFGYFKQNETNINESYTLFLQCKNIKSFSKYLRVFQAISNGLGQNIQGVKDELLGTGEYVSHMVNVCWYLLFENCNFIDAKQCIKAFNGFSYNYYAFFKNKSQNSDIIIDSGKSTLSNLLLVDNKFAYTWKIYVRNNEKDKSSCTHDFSSLTHNVLEIIQKQK